MKLYKHGIEVEEKTTSFPSPLSTRYGVQVIFGTAPIHLAESPQVNRPVLASTFEEAAAALGYSDDWETYTLCQAMYASFKLFQIKPVIFINVLDPERHVRELEKKTRVLSGGLAVLDEEGVLAGSLEVWAEPGGAVAGQARVGEDRLPGAEALVLKEGVDYITEYDEDGRLVIAVLSTGSAYKAGSLTVSAKVLAPDMVTEEDLIGSYDVESGKETGMELLRQVYPRYGLVPGMLLAPGWSHKENVGAALQMKCCGISGAFRCMCLLDLDTGLARKYMDCEKVKADIGYNSSHAVVLWPKVTAGGRVYCYSAVYGAMMSYCTASNGDVPYLYPSNKELNIDGAVLDDGTEVMLDQTQAGVINGGGVVTAFRDVDWVSYGNNTGCYPENTDPKDRWLGSRRMFDYVANYFIVEYRKKLDSSMNRRTVDDIVNKFNIWGSSLKSSGMCAGLYAEWRAEENAVEDVLEGRMKIRIFFAPYTPAEYIRALMEFDVSALESVMGGEE